MKDIAGSIVGETLAELFNLNQWNNKVRVTLALANKAALPDEYARLLQRCHARRRERAPKYECYIFFLGPNLTRLLHQGLYRPPAFCENSCLRCRMHMLETGRPLVVSSSVYQEEIASTTSPTLLLHGLRDEVVPHTHSLELYRVSAAHRKVIIGGRNW